MDTLGIADGTEVLCIMRQALFDVKVGLKILVTGGGSEEVNGVYVAQHVPESKSPYDKMNIGGKLRFVKEENPDLRVTWYAVPPSNVQWSAGWYFEKMPGYSGMYFQPSMMETCLPVDGWDVFTGECCLPDVQEPAPMIQVDDDVEK